MRLPALPVKEPSHDGHQPCRDPGSSPHRSQALHLCVGRRHRRRPREDEGPARRQGRGPGGDDAGRAAHPAGIHDHHRGLQRLLRGRQAAARGPVGRRPGRDEGGRAAIRQGVRRPGQPAARLGPLGRQVLDAGHDGHGPQPRAQRADAPGADRPHRQRALRLGRISPVHRDVRQDRHGRRRRELRRAPRAGQGTPRPRRQGHGPRRRRSQASGRGVQGGRPRGHRPRLPDRPVRAAGPGHQGRVRLVVRQARQRLPQQPEDRARPWHRRQRRDHGVRQHGRRLRAPALRSPATPTPARRSSTAST